MHSLFAEYTDSLKKYEIRLTNTVYLLHNAMDILQKLHDYNSTVIELDILCSYYSNDIDTFRILIYTFLELFCLYGKKSKVLGLFVPIFLRLLKILICAKHVINATHVIVLVISGILIII